MKTLIIEIRYGGLGDHLFYSHIPRIAKQFGEYEKVYISRKSILRNEQTKKLVWDINPFVDGFSDESGTSVGKLVFRNKENCNVLDKIMRSYDLDDGETWHEPEVYYNPRKIEYLSESKLYDPNYISNAGFVTSTKIENYLINKSISLTYQMVILGKNAIPVTRCEYLMSTPTIFDFIDALYSVKDVFCLVTGTATLACALNLKPNVFYTPDIDLMFRHSKKACYIKL